MRVHYSRYLPDESDATPDKLLTAMFNIPATSHTCEISNFIICADEIKWTNEGDHFAQMIANALAVASINRNAV